VSDHEKDIDALAFFLEKVGEGDPMRCDPEDASPWSKALTALVAEREEMKETIVLLRSRAESSEASNDTAFRIISERDGLRKRVVELDALKQRIADLESDNRALSYNNATLRGLLKSHPSADRDRDLRERDKAMELWMDQVTMMLCHSMTHSHDAKQGLVTRCDAAIAAMRKEGGGA
jgi:hypothetical protein